MNLGKFSDNPNKHIDVFQGQTQTFNLSWKDMVLLFSQTLSGSEKWSILDTTQQVGDECFLANANRVPHDQIGLFTQGFRNSPTCLVKPSVNLTTCRDH